MQAENFDVIIVGAGAAGCVLAARLSEATEQRILLIEAGPDAPADREHADILDPFPVSYGNPRFSWPRLIAEVGADRGEGRPPASRHYLQGYGVGGGSNIQGMAALRGIPEDYDEWRDHGISNWGWDDVLPYFNKLERDLDFSGPLHGKHGAMPIRRIAPADWAPLAKAVGHALERRGYPLIEDCNADFREGVSAMPMNNLPHRRVSASMAYLTQAVRQRPNLTIVADAFVERLEIRHGRAQGVSWRRAGGVQRATARETIIACGALHSPALLMRSGLGPADHLRALGIDVVHDLPGVGRNLQNHPEISVVTHLPRTAVQAHEQRSWGQNCLRFSSRIAACPGKDMLLVMRNKGSWHPLGRRMGGLGVAVYKPYSRGHVELAGADPGAPPRVRLNSLSDPRDAERLVRGLRLMLELMADKEVAAVRNEVFLANGKLVGRLNARSRWNWLRTSAIAAVFEISSLRRALLKETTLDVETLAQDEASLRELVRRRAQPTHHVCGTCKMGNAQDPQAVVDAQCRVRGVDSLRVVDASIFPTLMRANTHIPVIMAAEKMADHIKGA